jgi:membrane protease YdiL (CAAX protease family)
MKIPFFRHFTPLTQLFALYTFHFTGLLVSRFLALLLMRFIWHNDPEQALEADFLSDESIYINRIYMLIGGFLVFMGPATIFRHLMELNGQDYLRIRKKPSLKTTGRILLLLAACIPVSNFLIYANQLIDPTFFSQGMGEFIDKAQKQQSDLQLGLMYDTSTWLYLLNIASVAILAAIGEEFFYRGVVQRLFTKMLRNPHAAIVITSLIFSLMHFDYYGFLPRLFMGIVLGYVYLCTGNLWYGIIFHFLNNALPITSYWLLSYGYDTNAIVDFGSGGFTRWIALGLLAGLIVMAFKQLRKSVNQPLIREMIEY